jgi:Ca-activated chloride channel family protein
MTFIWPTALLLLIVVAGLAVLYVLAQRRRNRYALRYANLSLVREAIGKGPGWRRHVPAALFILALGFMAIAVARPQAIVAVPSQEGTVILAIDVSGSMLAEDMKPNRMEAAKAAARAFVEKQSESVKIGVVSFSGDASIVQSPTTDKTLVIAAINRLRPQRATAIGRAILVSLDAINESMGSEEDLPSSILQQGQPGASATPRPTATPLPAYLQGQHSSASIVLMSDGQNNQFPPPLDVIDQAVSRGVRVYTIGVGSAQGAIVRLQGRAVRTALDETTLKKIAEVTDAQYFNANTEADLRTVYENLTTQLVIRNEKTELTAYATLAAAILAVFAGAFSLLWFNRLP